MKQLVFALLVAAPSILVGWVVGRGQTSGPSDAVAVACKTDPVEVATDRAASDKGTKPSEASDDEDLLALFKNSLAGASIRGKVELYDEKGLFDYIDGAAPLYIERHFRRLAAAELVLQGGGELTGDVYDMSEPKNAESIMKEERSTTAEEVPSFPSAITGPRSFVFQHDRYYVKLTAFDANAEAALLGVARELRDRLR